MAAQARSRFPLSGRRAAIGVLVLVAVVAALVGSVLHLRGRNDHSIPTYHHTPNAVNTGKSLLYLSSPSFGASPTLLTMVRTSDGATLWQYSLHGALTTGETPTINEAIDAGRAVEVVNGVIYFVIDSAPLSGPSDAQAVMTLMALRASDGAIRWRQPVHGALVDLLGVSDGVVCLQVTQQSGSQLTASDLEGYSASDGSRVWQRQPSDIFGMPSGNSQRFGATLLDGILYTGLGANGRQGPTGLYALQASTGQTLWRYTQQGSSLPIYGMPAVAADGGVVVLYSYEADFTHGDASLIGVRESTGDVLWHYPLPSLIANQPAGGPNADGIFDDHGMLYFVTTASDGSLQANGLQLSTGSLLWRRQLATGRHILWNIAVGNGGMYTEFALPYLGPHPTFDGLTLTALDAEHGASRWQYHPATNSSARIIVTSDAVLLSTNTSLVGLRANDGALLWQRTLQNFSTLLAADNVGILSTVVSTGGNSWTGTLCGVQPASGAMRWCKQFATGLAAVVPGP